MSAIEKLRAIIAQNASPSCRFALPYADCEELLQEIDRMRSEAEGIREACARICDERAKSAANRLGDYDVYSENHARLESHAAEAEHCAYAIRSMVAP